MLKLWCERDTRFEAFLNQWRIEINWLQFCSKPYALKKYIWELEQLYEGAEGNWNVEKGKH